MQNMFRLKLRDSSDNISLKLYNKLSLSEVNFYRKIIHYIIKCVYPNFVGVILQRHIIVLLVGALLTSNYGSFWNYLVIISLFFY